jgi:hypothetical protein
MLKCFAIRLLVNFVTGVVSATQLSAAIASLGETLMGRRTCLALALGVIATFLAARSLPAEASPSFPNINTAGLSDGIFILDPAGAVFRSATLTEANEAGGFFIADILEAGLVDPSQFGNFTVLVEPDNSQSDLFGVFLFEGTALPFDTPVFGIQSDVEGVPSPLPVPPFQGTPMFVAESGTGFYDATRYLSQSLRDQGYTAVAFSDVPEPSTFALGILGVFFSVALAGGSHRKRGKKTAQRLPSRRNANVQTNWPRAPF